MADDYAEYDFEYLPNGGWGEPANILYTTPGRPTSPTPGRRSTSTPRPRQSFAGWHDLVLTIDNSTHHVLRRRPAFGHARRRATCPSGRCRSTSTSG